MHVPYPVFHFPRHPPPVHQGSLMELTVRWLYWQTSPLIYGSTVPLKVEGTPSQTGLLCSFYWLKAVCHNKRYETKLVVLFVFLHLKSSSLFLFELSASSDFFFFFYCHLLVTHCYSVFVCLFVFIMCYQSLQWVFFSFTNTTHQKSGKFLFRLVVLDCSIIPTMCPFQAPSLPSTTQGWVRPADSTQRSAMFWFAFRFSPCENVSLIVSMREWRRTCSYCGCKLRNDLHLCFLSSSLPVTITYEVTTRHILFLTTSQ